MADFAKLILAAETGDLKKARAELGKLTKAAGKSEKGITKSTKKMGTGFSVLSRSMASLGLAFSGGIIARKMFTDFAAFDRNVTKINTLVGVSREQTDEWRKGMIELSGVVGKSTEEMASGMFFITSAGLRGSAALDALEASAKGAAIGLGETNIIADAATSAVNAYGAGNINATKAVAILAATVREGKAEASAIAPVLGSLLPITSKLGVGFDQVGAAIAGMTRLGSPAAEAAVSLQAVLTTLAKGGTEDANKALKTLGTSFALLRKGVRQDGLLETLSDLKDRIGDNEEAMIKIFPNIRAMRGLFSLLGENLEANKKIFASLADTVEGDLQVAYDKWAASVEGRYTLAIQGLNKHLTTFGESAVPIAVSALEGLVSALGLVLENGGRLAAWFATGAAGVIAYQGALLAAGVAARGLVVSLKMTRTALIRTGLGAAAVLVGELVYQFILWKREMEGTITPVQDFTDRVDQLTMSVEDLGKAQRDLAISEISSSLVTTGIEIEEYVVKISEAEGELVRLRRSLTSGTADDNSIVMDAGAIIQTTKVLERMREGLSDLSGKYETNSKALKKLNEFTATATEETNKVVPTIINAAEAYEKWEEQILESMGALIQADELAARFGGTIDGLSEKSFDEMAKSVRGFVSEIEKQFGSLEKASLPVLAALADLQELLNEKGAEEFAAAIESLHPPLSAAVVDLETLVSVIKMIPDPLAEVSTMTKDLAAAFTALSAQGTAELSKLAAAAETSFSLITESGIANSAQLLEAERNALEARKALAIAVGIDLTTLEQERLDEILAMMGQHTDEMNQFAIQAARNIQTAFADFLFNPFDGGLKKMFGNFSKTLRRMAAEMAAAKLLGPGGMLGNIFTGGKDGKGGIFSGLTNKLGGVISKVGESIGGFVGKAVGATAKFIPIIGPLIGAAITSIIPKLGGLLFGGSFKTTNAGVQLGLGANGVTGSSFEEQHRKGGLFRKSKTRTKLTALDAATASGFQDAYDSIIDSAQVIFSGIGIDIDRSLLTAVRVAGLKISTKGKSQAEIQDLIDEWFLNLSDAVFGAAAESSGALGLLELARDGESASQAMMRLGSQLQGVNDVLEFMGATLLNVGVDGATFADDLIMLAGGIDALAKGVNSFVENFYSDEQKLERIQKGVNEVFAELGLEIPITREAMVALIAGLDLTTESGRTAFAALMLIAPQLDIIFTSFEEGAASAAKAAEDMARAAAKAAADQAAATAKLFQTSQHGTDAALGALRKSIEARKAVIQRERDESVRAAQEVSEAAQAANQAAGKAAQKALSALMPVVDAITSAVSSLRTSIAGEDAQTRASALSAVRQALATGNISEVGDAAGIAAKVESGNFSTAADFRREQVRTLTLLGRLGDEGERQVDQAEAAVSAIESQTASIERAATRASNQAALQFDEEIAALDDQLAKAEEQVNLLRGIETGVLSVAEALVQFRIALETERGLTITPPELVSPVNVRIEATLLRIDQYSRTSARTNIRILDIADREYREAQAAV